MGKYIWNIYWKFSRQTTAARAVKIHKNSIPFQRKKKKRPAHKRPYIFIPGTIQRKVLFPRCDFRQSMGVFRRRRRRSDTPPNLPL